MARIPPTISRRRDRRGRFNPRGHFEAFNGKLRRVRPLPTFKPKPVITEAAREAPARPVPAVPEAPAREAPKKPEQAPVEPRAIPAPSVKKRKASRLRDAAYTTWFKAMGAGFGASLEDLRNAKSPDLLSDDLEEYAAPAAFYSNQSGLLGRVKWQGIVPLEQLIEDLNIALQFAGEEMEAFDFRDAYEVWEYKYQVIEQVGEGDPRVIEEIRDSR